MICIEENGKNGILSNNQKSYFLELKLYKKFVYSQQEKTQVNTSFYLFLFFIFAFILIGQLSQLTVVCYAELYGAELDSVTIEKYF